MREVARIPSAAEQSGERSAATTRAIEFVVDSAASPGNVLGPLARLLLSLATKHHCKNQDPDDRSHDGEALPGDAPAEGEQRDG
jgi:hypothetical protein